jgi:hypothetical protein
MTDSVRGTGYIADPGPHLYHNFQATHPAALKPRAMALPASASLLEFAPPIQDQDGIGECVGRALASALYTCLDSKGAPPRAPFSARALYALAREIDRAALTPAGQDLPPLTDSGCAPNQAARAIVKYGLADVLDIDGGSLAAQPDKACTDLQLGEFEKCHARLFPMLTWTSVADDDPNKVNLCMQALAAGYPLVYAVDASTPDFQQYDGSGNLLLTGYGYDHMQYAVAYRTTGGKVEFLDVNSWSGSWGDGGRGWFSADDWQTRTSNLLIPRVTP